MTTARIITFPSLRQELQHVPPVVNGNLEVMHIPVEWNRYCDECDAERIFVARLRCDAGFIATCNHCGAQRLAPFTRTNMDVQAEDRI